MSSGMVSPISKDFAGMCSECCFPIHRDYWLNEWDMCIPCYEKKFMMTEPLRDYLPGLKNPVNSENTFTKHDTDKPRFDYIPQEGLLEVAKVATFGANKYAPHNWKLCDDPTRYIAAAQRHINQYLRGEVEDSESMLNHLAHAAWNLMASIDIWENNGV